MTGEIRLSGLQVYGHHGVFEHERRAGQEFVVDAVLVLDTDPAARSDDLADTVDYGALAEGLAAVVEGEPCNLIEKVAGRLLEVCLSDPKVVSAEVTLHKPSAPISRSFTDVSVTLRGERSSRFVPVSDV